MGKGKGKEDLQGGRIEHKRYEEEKGVIGRFSYGHGRVEQREAQGEG